MEQTNIQKETEKQNINIVIEQKENSYIGIISIVFGALAIFTVGLLSIIGLILSIISFFKKGNFWYGVLGFILNIIAIIVSPTVWVFILGVFGVATK